MAIAFSCGCGRALKAREELAGKRAKCPQCGEIVEIPRPQPSPTAEDEVSYGLAEPPPSPSRPLSEDETAVRPVHSTFRPARPDPRRDEVRPKPTPGRPAPASVPGSEPGGSSIMEYSYVLLLFALIPLIVSLLGKDEKIDIVGRVEKTLAGATPDQVARAMPVLTKDSSLDEVIGVMPNGRLEGAHLSRDTSLHWVYAAIASTAFLLLLLAFFSVERANPLHLLGIGAFTGTVGIIFLFAVQFCSQLRVRRIGGRGIIALIFLILMFIGWSYDSANDPGSNFLLSALGYTFGVGLCEEFTKAIPLFFYFKRDASMGWRGACLWGLASGIGFGVSEGIMYSARHYNGVSGVDIYLVRFISCVALHAMWSASVGIAIARNVEAYDGVEDAAGFGLFMLRIMAAPMVLHGFYDTLLKKDMNGWALAVALLSFGFLAAQIELARGAMPGPGIAGRKKRRPAY